MTLDDRNFWMDGRTLAAMAGPGQLARIGKVDGRTMTIVCDLSEVDDDDLLSERATDGTMTLPAKYEVCDLCHGQGTVVDPNIDGGGISSGDEFWDDDEDRETGESRYWRGDYDMTCPTCGGKRVVLVVDTRSLNDRQKKLVKWIDAMDEADWAYARECAAERAMGA